MTYSYYQGSIEDNPYTAKWGMADKFFGSERLDLDSI